MPPALFVYIVAARKRSANLMLSLLIRAYVMRGHAQTVFDDDNDDDNSCTMLVEHSVVRAHAIRADSYSSPTLVKDNRHIVHTLNMCPQSSADSRSMLTELTRWSHFCL